MTFPALIFALLIASLYGALYHLIRDGGLGRLILFIILSWIGFTLGHFVGLWKEWSLFPIGQINIGISSLGSLILLIMGDWASRIGNANDQPFPDE